MSEKTQHSHRDPTDGAAHLGHYVGALENWVNLQHEYDCSFLIADYQVSDYGAEPEGALRTHGRKQQRVEGSADNGAE